MTEQSPATVSLVAQALTDSNATKEAAALLLLVQNRYRDDFRINYDLGEALRMTLRPAEALRYHQAALALRPNSPSVFNVLGADLAGLQRFDEAILARRGLAGASRMPWPKQVDRSKIFRSDWSSVATKRLRKPS